MITFVGISTIVLPSPEFGNKEMLNLRTTIKRTMSGKPFTFINDPPKSRYELTFRNMNGRIWSNFRNFLTYNRGKTITYIDFNNVAHRGRITNNPFVVSQQGIKNRSFTLTFEVSDG